MKLNTHSQKELENVHEDLRKVLLLASENDFDFQVVQGKRTIATQLEDLKKGASKTIFSNHLLGHAVDLCPLNEEGNFDWNNNDAFTKLSQIIKECASKLGVSIHWGGDWVHFKDYPHYEIIGHTITEEELIQIVKKEQLTHEQLEEVCIYLNKETKNSYKVEDFT